MKQITEIIADGHTYYMVNYLFKWENIEVCVKDKAIKLQKGTLENSYGFLLVFEYIDEAERFINEINKEV